MTFYPNERIALFIDGVNLHAASRGLGIDVDFRKMLEEFKKRGRLVRAYYYTAFVEDAEYSPVKPLIDWLGYNGYTVITKAAREFIDPATGRRRVKGDMDVDLAVDMLEMSAHVDHMLLFSGDGDFRKVVEAVQRRGPRVSVVSTIKTQPPMAADDLRRQADTFIELADLMPLIGRAPRPEGSENRRTLPSPGRPAPVAAGRPADDDGDEDGDYEA
jgi:uncharacterized LabA/DUF88 family protein